MAGRHFFDRLRAGLSAEGRAQAAALTDAMERELSLAELCRARAMTQDQLAVDQADNASDSAIARSYQEGK
jgi:hypothetical protein